MAGNSDMTRTGTGPATSTRTKLLAAAEAILVQQGITGVSVRRVGEHAGVNPTLVTYHFGSIGKLLDELCTLNLDPILDDWQAIDVANGRTLDEVLEAWLLPMLRPAAFTPGGRALVVLDEIAVHGEEDLRDRVMRAMEAFSQRLRAALAPHCPRLAEEELRARLRYVSGAVLGPPPRGHGAQAPAGRRLDDPYFLLRFAKAAFTG